MESNRRVFLAGLGGLAGGSLLLWTVRRELSAPSVLVSADSNSGGPVKIVQFDDAGKKLGVVTVPKVVKTDEEWRKLLEPEQYRVTRHSGTERAFQNAYFENHAKGLYRCICCNNVLFNSDTNLNRAPAGPASGRPSRRKTFLFPLTTVSACPVTKSPAVSATPTSATFSTTAPAPPACAIA